MPFPSLETIRSAAALTTTYVAATDLDVSGGNQVVLFLTITKGSLNTIWLKAEVVVRVTATTDRLFQELTSAAGGGVVRLRPLEYRIEAVDLAGAGPHYLYLPIPVLGDRVRVWAKGTDDPNGSSLSIMAAAGLV